MHIKYIKKFTVILLISLVSGHNIIKAQAPRDYFNLIFENNFEDDQTGKYSPADFYSDWKTYGNNRQNTIDILTESDSRHHQYMRGYFPRGTFGPIKGGWSWKAPLQGNLNEMYFSYDIRFKPGFQWVQGGKIPGITGGKTSSSVRPAFSDGFSVRMMWKQHGQLVFYVYHHDQQIVYGSTYEFDNFNFVAGKWYNITIRIVLNSVSGSTASNNGILEGFVDGKLLFQRGNFRFRNYSTIFIDKLYICSFFGGGDTEWNAARDEWIDTDNYVAYTYSSKALNVPKGGAYSSKSKTLLHPYGSGAVVIAPSKSSTTSILYAPASLITTKQTSYSVSIKWTDNSTNEQGFKIYRSVSPNSGFAQIGLVASNGISFTTNNNLKPGTVYYFKVRAYNSTGYSPYSSVLKVITKTTKSTTTSSTMMLNPDSAQKSGEIEIDSLRSPPNNFTVEVYPNPVSDQATITVSPVDDLSHVSKTIVRIVDMLGKEFFHETLPESNGKFIKFIDFSDFPKGVYFLEVTKGTERKTENIVLQ